MIKVVKTKATENALKKSVKQSSDKDRLDAEDRKIPRAAGGAFRAAYRAALDAGLSVVIARNGRLLRIHPDGSSELLKTIEKPVKVKRGTIIRLQWPTKSQG